LLFDDIFGDVDDELFADKKNKKDKSQPESKSSISKSQPKSELCLINNNKNSNLKS